MRISPLAVLAFGILVVSTAALMASEAIAAGVPSLIVATGRLGIAALVLAPLAGWRARDDLRAMSGRERWWSVGAGVMLAIHFATWFASLRYTSIASSTALVATVPIWSALLAWLIWRERPTKPLMAGAALACAGSMLIGFSDSGGGGGSNPLLGDALALVGAVASAGYFLCGREARRHTALLPYITWAYGTAAVVLVGWAVAMGTPLTGYGMPAFWLIAALALGPQLLGHSALNWSLRYLSATYVTVAILGEPIGATLLAWAVGSETPRLLQLLGGAILLSGITLASIRPKAAAPGPLAEEPGL